MVEVQQRGRRHVLDPVGSGAGPRHPAPHAVIPDRARSPPGEQERLLQRVQRRSPSWSSPTPAAACRGGEVEDGSHSPSQVRYFFTIYSSLHGNLSSSPNSWFLIFFCSYAGRVSEEKVVLKETSWWLGSHLSSSTPNKRRFDGSWHHCRRPRQ